MNCSFPIAIEQLKINVKPIKINIIQAHEPFAGSDVEKLKTFYSKHIEAHKSNEDTWSESDNGRF